MTATPQVTILPAQGCRRSRKLLAYLQAQGIPFTQIDLESPEGQELATLHDLRASPGILVDGVVVNPFELLIQPACRVDEDKACAVFGLQRQGRESQTESARQVQFERTS